MTCATGSPPEPLARYLRRGLGDDAWLWTRIQARIETAVALDVEIAEARETLAQMETDT